MIHYRLFIDWQRTGTYTDETELLFSATGQTRIGSPEESIASPKGQVGQMKLTLFNRQNRYSTLNTASAIYAQIAGGAYYQVPVRLEISTSDSTTVWNRVFTGVIKQPVETPVTYKEAGTIAFDCRSREDVILQKRISTSYVVFREISEEGWTESQIMAQWLQDAGLTSTEYSLDPGLFVIPWAWLDDESAIEDVWQLAAACGGNFYCGADGILRYENMQHWVSNTTITETLRKGSYQTCTMKIDDGDLYESVLVHAQRREIRPEGVVWESDDIPFISPLSSKDIIAQLQQPLYSYVSTGYSALTSGGTNMSGNIQITPQIQAQRIKLTVVNSHSTRTAYLHQLQITGKAVGGGPQDTIEKTSTNAFWTNRGGRTRSLRGNNYIQSQAQAETLATFLRDRHELPRMSYTMSGVPGSSSRRIGGRVAVIDSTLFTGTRHAFIIGINWQLTAAGGYLQNLELVDAESIYPYSTGGTNGYFMIGTDKLGVNSKRVFY